MDHNCDRCHCYACLCDISKLRDEIEQLRELIEKLTQDKDNGK